MPHLTCTSVVLRRIVFGSLLLAVAPLPLQAQSASSADVSEVSDASEQSEGFFSSLVVKIARAQIGRRYIWGGNGPESGGFDCSGFTRYLMQALNVSLPRTADQQARVGQAVPKELDRLRVGDLLTFGNSRRISHIGVYIGNGRVIHASSYYGKVMEVAFHPGTSLYRRWYGVRRVVAQEDSLGGRPSLVGRPRRS